MGRLQCPLLRGAARVWPHIALCDMPMTLSCMVAGTRAHAEDLRDEVAEVLQPMGLRLSEEKTKTVHIDEGFDFFGLAHPAPGQAGRPRRRTCIPFRRRRRFGSSATGYGRSPKESIEPCRSSVLLRPDQPGPAGLDQLFPARCVSKATFSYLEHLHMASSRQLASPQASSCQYGQWVRRRYLPRWRPTEGRGQRCSTPRSVTVSRYRYRGTRIPSPWYTAGRGPLA